MPVSLPVSLPVYGGSWTRVDPDLARFIREHRHPVHLGAGRGLLRYVMSTINGQPVYLHRIALGATGALYDDLEVHHRNGDPLDNRRCNLQLLTREEHQRLTSRWAKPRGRYSPYKGVSFNKQAKRFVAQIGGPGKATTHLGSFQTAEEAALARDRAVIARWGIDGGYLNFRDLWESGELS